MEPVAVPAQRAAMPPPAMFTSYGPAAPQNLVGGLPPTISYGSAPVPMAAVTSSMASHGPVARQPQASTMVGTPISQTAQPMQPVQSVALSSPGSVAASAAQSVVYSQLAQSMVIAAPTPQNVLPTGQSIVMSSPQQQVVASPAQSLQMVQPAGFSPVAGTTSVVLPPIGSGAMVLQPSPAGSGQVLMPGLGVATPMAQAPIMQSAQTADVGGTIVKESAADRAVSVKDAAVKKKSKKAGKKDKRCWGCCD